MLQRGALSAVGACRPSQRKRLAHLLTPPQAARAPPPVASCRTYVVTTDCRDDRRCVAGGRRRGAARLAPCPCSAWPAAATAGRLLHRAAGAPRVSRRLAWAHVCFAALACSSVRAGTREAHSRCARSLFARALSTLSTLSLYDSLVVLTPAAKGQPPKKRRSDDALHCLGCLLFVVAAVLLPVGGAVYWTKGVQDPRTVAIKAYATSAFAWDAQGGGHSAWTAVFGNATATIPPLAVTTSARCCAEGRGLCARHPLTPSRAQDGTSFSLALTQSATATPIDDTTDGWAVNYTGAWAYANDTAGPWGSASLSSRPNVRPRRRARALASVRVWGVTRAHDAHPAASPRTAPRPTSTRWPATRPPRRRMMDPRPRRL